MALTATQQTNIVFYLGWPAKVLDITSVNYNRTINQRLENLTTETETLVDSLLTQINDVRTKFTSSTSRMLVKRVGDIELNPDEKNLLASEYRRLIKDLARLLDIPNRGSSGINIPVVI